MTFSLTYYSCIYVMDTVKTKWNVIIVQKAPTLPSWGAESSGTNTNKCVLCFSRWSCFLISCFSGKPVMIITEYMENGSLDTFLKVGHRGRGEGNLGTREWRMGRRRWVKRRMIGSIGGGKEEKQKVIWNSKWIVFTAYLWCVYENKVVLSQTQISVGLCWGNWQTGTAGESPLADMPIWEDNYHRGEK